MIQWTNKEWEDLAEEVYRLRLEDITSPLAALVKEAIKILPLQRQRAINGIHQVKRLVEAVTLKMQILRDSAAQLQGLKKRLADTEALINDLDDNEVKRMFGKRVLRMVTPQEVVDFFNTEELVGNIKTDELVGIAAKRFIGELLHKEPQILHKANGRVQQVLPTRSRKPKVAIIGLLSNQQSIITKQIGEVCELRFVSKDTDTIPKNCEIYVVWVKFVSHVTTDLVKEAAKDGIYIQHSGGIESMVTAIEERLLKLC